MQATVHDSRTPHLSYTTHHDGDKQWFGLPICNKSEVWNPPPPQRASNHLNTWTFEMIPVAQINFEDTRGGFKRESIRAARMKNKGGPPNSATISYCLYTLDTSLLPQCLSLAKYLIWLGLYFVSYSYPLWESLQTYNYQYISYFEIPLY